MVECNDTRCKQKLDDLDLFVRGKEPHSGLIGEIERVLACCKEKVPKSWIWKFISIFGISIILSAFYLYHKVDSSSLEFMSIPKAQAVHESLSKAITDNKLDNKIIGERNAQQYSNICSQLTKINQELLTMSKRLERIERAHMSVKSLQDNDEHD